MHGRYSIQCADSIIIIDVKIIHVILINIVNKCLKYLITMANFKTKMIIVKTAWVFSILFKGGKSEAYLIE